MRVDYTDFVSKRGPRWAITGNVRRDETVGTYAVTGAEAERIYDEYLETGYYQVKVTPPEGGNEAALVAERAKAQAALSDVMQRMRAYAIHAIHTQGRDKAEVARALSTTRTTIDKWLDGASEETAA